MGRMKRALDLLLALALALPSLVIVILFGLLIRLDSPGPAIFRQVRVGRNKAQFTILKLRTMKTGTGDMPSHFADPRNISRLGQLIRSLKLDELPQLYNVIVGDMSFVGPRPCLPTQTELIAARNRSGVFVLRPGITGIAQLEGIDMSEPERLASVDALYLAPWSLATDLRLMWSTALGKGNGDAIVSDSRDLD